MNRKNDNDITIFRHDIIVNFFDVALFLLLSLIIGDNFLSKGIDQKSGYPKYPHLSFAHLSADYSFYRYWVIKVYQQGGVKLLPPHID